jgi:hypothetical protein
MGLGLKRGIDLYLSEHPERGVNFVYEDHRYDGKTTVSGFHALRDRAKPSLYVVWGNTPAESVAPVAEQLKAPLFAVTMNPAAKDRQFVVTFGSLTEVIARFSHSIRALKASSPGSVTVDLGSTIEALKLIEADLQQEFHKEIVASDEVDFKSTVLKLRSKKIDPLILFLLPQQALTFLKQSKQMGYQPRVIGGDVFASDSFRREAQTLTDNCSFVYGGVKRDFLDKLRQSPEGSSYFFEVATGYSIAAIVDQAMSKQKGATIEKSPILDQLTAVDLAGLPISLLKFVNNKSQGRHFEVGHLQYSTNLEQ